MYLIDTHVLLWLLSDQDKLSATAKIILQEEELFISMASLWEIAIKQSNGKLDLPFSPEELCAICQSIAENIPILTHDSKIPLYPVATVW